LDAVIPVGIIFTAHSQYFASASISIHKPIDKNIEKGVKGSKKVFFRLEKVLFKIIL
jgi:hypothetical protein